MKIFADWTLSRKLVSAFALVLFFNILALALALWHVTRLTERLDYMIDVRVEAVKVAARLNRGIVEMRSREKDALLSDSAAFRLQARENINEIQVQFEQRLDAIKSLELSEASLEILIRLGSDYKLYSHALTRVLDLVKEGKIQEASAVSRDEGEQLSNRARDHSVKFNDIQEEELLSTRETVRRNSQRTFLGALALALGAVALGLLTSILVGRSIGSALSRLVTLSNAIAEGKLDTPVHSQGRDEVGLLTTARWASCNLHCARLAARKRAASGL